MDNKEFDKIFKTGLNEMQSFDQAEESWQKLQPRLHPPKKRRRFVIWPFLFAAVILLGITTFWFYQQSATLQEDVAVLNEQLKQQTEEETEKSLETKTEELEASANEAVDAKLSTDQNEDIINITDQEENFSNERSRKNVTPTKQISPVNEEKNNIPASENLLPGKQDVVINEPAILDAEKNKTVDQNILLSDLAANEENKTKQGTVLAVDELANNFWLLKFERAMPSFALLANEKEDNKKESKIIKGFDPGFSAGVNGGMAWVSDIVNLWGRSDVQETSLSFLDSQPNFFQLGAHANYSLNRNWQLHSSVNHEQVKIQYVGAVFSNSFDIESIEEDELFMGQNINEPAEIVSYISSNYRQTKVLQKNWMVQIGIRRRLFSINKLNAFAGVYSTTRFFQRQAISFLDPLIQPSADLLLDEIKASATANTELAITPSFGIGSPIGKKFYWSLEAKYDIQVSGASLFELPKLGIGLNAGYKF